MVQFISPLSPEQRVCVDRLCSYERAYATAATLCLLCLVLGLWSALNWKPLASGYFVMVAGFGWAVSKTDSLSRDMRLRLGAADLSSDPARPKPQGA